MSTWAGAGLYHFSGRQRDGHQSTAAAGHRAVPAWRLIVLVALMTSGPPATPPGRNPRRNESAHKCEICGSLLKKKPLSTRWICSFNPKHKQSEDSGRDDRTPRE